jgi:hypothetical protein
MQQKVRRCTSAGKQWLRLAHAAVRFLCSAAVAWAMPTIASAQVTYNYLGQAFTSADPPYTTAERVSGSFELASRLPAMRPLSDIQFLIVDFSFSDGVQTRTPANSTVCAFQVATDAAGNIVQWTVLLREAPTPAPGNPQQALDSTTGHDLVGTGPAGATACAVITLSPAASSSGAGSWTSTLPPGTPTTYSYLGQPFTDAAVPYAIDGRVTGNILLGDPLPPNLSLTDISAALIDFSFTDGVQTRTPANTTICLFQVATDAAGDIVQWQVILREPALSGATQETLDSFLVGGNGHDLVGSGPAGANVCGLVLLDPFANNSLPGSWTLMRAVAEVPTLGPIALAALAALLLLAARRALADSR